MPENSKDLELSVQHPTGILLWKVSNLLVKALNKALSPFGVTHAQFVLLFLIRRLAQMGEEATQVRLAGISDMDPMVVSQALRSLEAKGLIRRRTSRRDARAKAVSVTPAGERIVTDALDAVLATNDRFYAGLAKEEGRLRVYLKQLLDENASEA